MLRKFHPDRPSVFRDVPDWLMNKSLSCKAVVCSDQRIKAAVNKSLAVHRTNKQLLHTDMSHGWTDGPFLGLLIQIFQKKIN